MSNPFSRLVSKFTKKRSGYEGASRGRRTKNWLTTNASVDTILRGSALTLRSRSRDLVRNNPYAASGVNYLADYIVGEGVIGNIRHENPRIQELLNEEWRLWTESKQCDFDGRNDFAGLQRLVVESMMEAGEVLVRTRTKTSGFPLELQILEADFLPIEGAFANTGAQGENQVIHGIEYNAKGKRVAYHLYEEHPGAESIWKFNSTNTVRVSADEVGHVFRVRRPGQSRGTPVVAPVILRLRDLDEYEDAQLTRQKIAACFAAFVHDLDGAGTELTTSDVELLERVEPGIIEHLPPGKTITFGNPPSVQNYAEYMSVNLRAVAAGLQISYEALTGDLSNTNFSSGRMGHLRTLRTIATWRNVFKVNFLDFVAQKWLQRAFLQGLPVKGAWFVWTPPKIDMIDPTKEIPAAIKSIRGGLSTLSQEIRARGRHPTDVFSEWAEDAKALDELKLVFDTDPRTVTQQGNFQKEEGESNANQEEQGQETDDGTGEDAGAE